MVIKLVKSPKFDKKCCNGIDDLQLVEDSKPEGLADRLGSNIKYKVTSVTLVN